MYSLAIEELLLIYIMDVVGIETSCSSTAVIFGCGTLSTHMQTELEDNGVDHHAVQEPRVVVENAAAVHRNDDDGICWWCVS